MVQNYTRKRSDAFAMFLQVILRTRLSLGLLEKQNNVYFRMCLFTGSFDMYECFIEEFVEPYFEKDLDEKMEYIIDLYTVAEQTIEVLLNNYTDCIKGVHFNGPFSKVEGNDELVIMYEEDYLAMNQIVENFNRIVGRRDILTDLEARI
jgi:hypothetical protein